MNNLKLISYLICIISLVLFYSCSSNSKKDIKIGAVLPLTGELASYGKWTKDGIDLAVEEINKTRKANDESLIKILYEDDQSTPNQAVSGLQKLISIENVKVVIGDLASGFTLNMAPIAEQKHVILFSPASSSPLITNAGDYIFRNWPSDIYESKALANYLLKQNKKRIGIIAVNNDFGVGIDSAFVTYFKAVGGAVAYNEFVSENKNSYRSEIQKIKNIPVDGMYIIGYATDVAKTIKAIKEALINVSLFSTSSAENQILINMLGKNANGLVYTAPSYDANSSDSLVKQFVMNFKNKYNYLPPLNAATGYDAVRILIYAINNVGYNANLIKDFLVHVKDFPGVSGKTTFDNNGDVAKPIILKIIKNDMFEMLKN